MTAVAVRGIASWLDFGEPTCHAFIEVFLFAYIVMLYVSAAMFLLRYAQSIGHRRLLILLADARYAFAVAALVVGTFSFGMFLLLSRVWMPATIVSTTLEASDPELLKAAADGQIVAADVRRWVGKRSILQRPL